MYIHVYVYIYIYMYMYKYMSYIIFSGIGRVCLFRPQAARDHTLVFWSTPACLTRCTCMYIYIHKRNQSKTIMKWAHFVIA